MSTPDALVAELAAADVQVRDVWDLVNTAERYPAAIPVLLRWLDQVSGMPPNNEREKLREGIIRALSVPYARPTAARPLIEQFRTAPGVSGLGMGWVIGSALGVVADHTVADGMIELLCDRSLGRAREMLCEAVPRIAKHRPDIVPVMRSLLDDESIRPFVIQTLGILRDIESRDEIARYAQSNQALTRKKVNVALRRIDFERKRTESRGQA